MTQVLDNFFLDGVSLTVDKTGNHQITNYGVTLDTEIKKFI